jgi:hypothetical protein
MYGNFYLVCKTVCQLSVLIMHEQILQQVEYNASWSLLLPSSKISRFFVLASFICDMHTLLVTSFKTASLGAAGGVSERQTCIASRED